MKRALALLSTGALAAGVLAVCSAWAGPGPELTVKEIAPGSMAAAEGLEAWRRLYAVYSHPRCANCHVDRSNRPMWSGKEYARPGPHGFNVNAGGSRMGAESLPCRTCHVTSTRPNDMPHAAPHTGMPWQLAPVEFVWFSQTSKDMCAQVRDPARNGGRDGRGLIEHVVHDAREQGFISWGFNPGAGREKPPGDLQTHLDDLAQWIAASMPCPTE